jgi:hypothetical protein
VCLSVGVGREGPPGAGRMLPDPGAGRPGRGAVGAVWEAGESGPPRGGARGSPVGDGVVGRAGGMVACPWVGCARGSDGGGSKGL